MPKATYPTSADLSSFLTTAGFASATVAALDLATAIAAGIASFEREAGRKMLWLAATAAEQRRYDPPQNRDGLLFLADDLCELTSLVYEPYQGSATTLTADDDYELEPYNALLRGQPVTKIRFLHRRWLMPLSSANRRSLKITAKWAYAISTFGFPDDAWEAMRAHGAWALWPSLRQAVTGGMLSWSEAGVNENYGVESWTGLRDLWDDQYQSAVKRYRRAEMAL